MSRATILALGFLADDEIRFSEETRYINGIASGESQFDL